MLKLPTVILYHQTASGSHYDWLWLDPVSSKHLLGVRVPCPPNQWVLRQSFLAQPLAPHRLAYLTYQGKVSGDRGSVVQVAKGFVLGQAIGEAGWDWQLKLKSDCDPMRLRLTPVSDRRWRCCVTL